MVGTAFSLLATTTFLSVPVIMIWGWVRWSRQEKSFKSFSILSLLGLTLATLSELLAISMVLYARISGGFGCYDPFLMKIYACGMLLSTIGLIVAIIGVWRPSPMRWQALVCTLGTLLYWLVQAANE
jgi:predicted membrane protein